MLWSYILKLFVLLPLVCGLMVGCLWLWRRLESRMPGQPANRAIKVQETMMLSPGLDASRRPGMTNSNEQFRNLIKPNTSLRQQHLRLGAQKIGQLVTGAARRFLYQRLDDQHGFRRSPGASQAFGQRA